LKLKFQTVAEKTAKNFRGLLYFAAPGIQQEFTQSIWWMQNSAKHCRSFRTKLT